jgi:hypothetical protein
MTTRRACGWKRGVLPIAKGSLVRRLPLSSPSTTVTTTTHIYTSPITKIQTLLPGFKYDKSASQALIETRALTPHKTYKYHGRVIR